MRSPVDVLQEGREPPLRISVLHCGRNSIDDDLNTRRIQTEQLEVSRNFELALLEDASERSESVFDGHRRSWSPISRFGGHDAHQRCDFPLITQ
jgi:hypothetical protein